MVPPVLVAAVCENPCLNNGTCVAPHTCLCPHGRTGRACESFFCAQGCVSGQGACVGPNECLCASGYQGPDCGECESVRISKAKRSPLLSLLLGLKLDLLGQPLQNKLKNKFLALEDRCFLRHYDFTLEWPW